MTSSDKKMDRALASLAQVAPQRSVWPEIENRLKQHQRSRYWRRWFGVSASAVAASLLVGMLVVHQRQPAEGPVDDFQKTIDAAIRDARPAARFTGLEYVGSKPSLEALLISSTPRDDMETESFRETVGKKPESSSIGKGVDEF
jgi:hypothetical protein